MSTTPNYTTYSGHSNATIVPTTNAELKAALAQLSSSGGGTIVLDANYGPFQINASNLGDANSPILIKSADDNNPAFVEKVSLDNVSHLTITGVTVDNSTMSNPPGVHGYDVVVKNSDHIELADNAFTGQADQYLTFSNLGERASGGVSISNSSDVHFSDNEVSGYFTGITFANVSRFSIADNDIHSLQGDGLHGGGWVDAVVSGNHFHDFYGANNNISHGDMIQMWGINSGPRHSNVEISGNVLDSSGMAPTQGIFVANEEFGSGSAKDGYFDDIRIFDNIVHNGYGNGITVNSTSNAQIYNNTVLWDQEANSHIPGDSTYLKNSMPRIQLNNSPGSEVWNNVAGKVGGYSDSSNFIVEYYNSAASTFVGKHVEDWSGGGDGLRDFDEYAFKSTSPLYGSTGSSLSSGATWDTSNQTPTSGGSTSGGGVQPPTVDTGSSLPGGDTSGGVPTGGDTTGGNAAGGDTSGGDQSGEGASGGETTGGESAGESASGGETAGGEAAGGETAGGDQSGEGASGGEATGGETAGESASGGETSGGETSGGVSSGDGEPSGDGGTAETGDDAGDTEDTTPGGETSSGEGDAPADDGEPSVGDSGDGGDPVSEGSGDGGGVPDLGEDEDATPEINEDLDPIDATGADTPTAAEDEGTTNSGGVAGGDEVPFIPGTVDTASGSDGEASSAGEDAEADGGGRGFRGGRSAKAARNRDDDEGEDGNVMAKLFSMFFGFFGGKERDEPETPGTSEAAKTSDTNDAEQPTVTNCDVCLDEVVPVTGWYDDGEAPVAGDRSDEEDEEDELLVA